MVYTRTDKKIIEIIQDLIESMKTIKCSSSSERQKERIRVVKQVFSHLTTTAGINFVKKYENVETVIREKLAEFTSYIPDLTRKWHLQIFGEELPKEVETLEIGEEESGFQNNQCKDIFEKWVEEIMGSIPLTRNRRKMLEEIWDTLDEMEGLTKEQDYIEKGESIYKILTSDIGKDIIKNSNTFSISIQEELRSLASFTILSATDMLTWWTEVFGYN